METLEATPTTNVQESLARAKELAYEFAQARKFGDVLREREIAEVMNSEVLPQLEKVVADKKQRLQELRTKIAELEEPQTQESDETVEEVEPPKETTPKTMSRRDAIQTIGGMVAVGMSGMLGGVLLSDSKKKKNNESAADVPEKPKPEEEKAEEEPKPEPEKEEEKEETIEARNENKEALPRRAHELYEYFKGMHKVC
jgi:hypothetical protein